MTSSAGEPIPISALQHAVYCLRQAALIHLERLWAENRFTAEGDVLHAVADKGGSRKARGARLVMSLPLASARLNLTGTAKIKPYPPVAPSGVTPCTPFLMRSSTSRDSTPVFTLPSLSTGETRYG